MFGIKPVKPVEFVRASVDPITNGPSVAQLRNAAKAFAQRTDSFAAGKADICISMAQSLERDGHFRSAKQQEFAAKLVTWAVPRKPVVDLKGDVIVPKLFDVMQRHSTFHAGAVKLQRKNQDSLVWIVYAMDSGENVCIGKIEDARVTLFFGRMRTAAAEREPIIALLREFDADPLAAAMKYGKLSGRCCSCGRDLTDPESIERGIGPVCATKFA